MNNSQSPFVSIIMPVRNEGAFIRKSLGAVLSQDYAPDCFEVIVVDGLSDDGTREYIEEVRVQYPNIRVIDNKIKIVAPGLNKGIQNGKGAIVIRVDGHCVIAPDYVRQCVRLLEEKKADAVGGPIETIGETFVSKAIAAAMSSWFGVGGSAFRTIKNKEIEVETVPFPAYRKEVFTRIGYFDEELVRNQDDEFNYRLKKAGGKILLSPAIKSQYYSRGNLKSLASQYFQYGYWKVRVMQKHPRQMRLRQFVPALFVCALLLGTAFLVEFGLFILAIYLAVNLTVSLVESRRHGWKYLGILPVVYAVLHLSYGSGFLTGIMRFAGKFLGR